MNLERNTWKNNKWSSGRYLLNSREKLKQNSPGEESLKESVNVSWEHERQMICEKSVSSFSKICIPCKIRVKTCITYKKKWSEFHIIINLHDLHKNSNKREIVIKIQKVFQGFFHKNGPCVAIKIPLEFQCVFDDYFLKNQELWTASEYSQRISSNYVLYKFSFKNSFRNSLRQSFRNSSR